MIIPYDQQAGIDLLTRMHEGVEETKNIFVPGLEWFRFLNAYRDCAIEDIQEFMRGLGEGRDLSVATVNQLTERALSKLGVEASEFRSKPTRTLESWREYCVDLLKASDPREVDAVGSYVEEAEHQDGMSYWTNFEQWTFAGVKALLEDFRLYADNFYCIE